MNNTNNITTKQSFTWMQKIQHAFKKKRNHSVTPTNWILDASALGKVDQVTWVENKLSIRNQSHHYVITLGSGLHTIKILRLQEEGLQTGSITQNKLIQWDFSQPTGSISASDLQKILKKSTNYTLKNINYIRVEQYKFGNYTGIAWYEVKKKRYIITKNISQNIALHAVLKGILGKYAYFFIPISEKPLAMINHPVFWVTNIETQQTVLQHFLTLKHSIEEQVATITLQLARTTKGFLLAERYLVPKSRAGGTEFSMRYNLDIDAGQSISIPTMLLHAFEFIPSWAFFYLENEHIRYESIKQLAIFFNGMFSAVGLPYVFRSDSLEKIASTEYIRLGFANAERSVLWFFKNQSKVIKGCVAPIDQAELFPLLLFAGSGNIQGYWMREKPAEETSIKEPVIELWRQNLTAPFLEQDGRFGDIIALFPLQQLIYVYAKYGAIYVVDRSGEIHLYGIAKAWFKPTRSLTEFKQFIHTQTCLPLVVLPNCYGSIENHSTRSISMLVIYNTHNQYFYIAPPSKRYLVSNDSKQGIFYSQRAKELSICEGFDHPTFISEAHTDKNGNLWFNFSEKNGFLKAFFSLKLGTMPPQLMNNKLTFELPNSLTCSLHLVQNHGKYRLEIVSLPRSLFYSQPDSQTVEKKLFEITQYFLERENLLNWQVFIPDIIRIDDYGWFNTKTQRAFILSEKSEQKTALLLGFSQDGMSAYCLQHRTEIIRIGILVLPTNSRMSYAYDHLESSMLVFKAKKIIPLYGGLLIWPSTGRSIKDSEISRLANIDDIGILHLQLGETAQILSADSWETISLTITMQKPRSKKGTLTIDLQHIPISKIFLAGNQTDLLIKIREKSNILCIRNALIEDIGSESIPYIEFRLWSESNPPEPITLNINQLVAYHRESKQQRELEQAE